MRIKKGHVLLRITAEDKRKLFQKDLKTFTGETISLFQEMEIEDEGMADYFAQSVEVAEVIAVADDVTHIKVGDIAVIDYVVDTLREEVVYSDHRGKILCIDTVTTFHEDDHMVYAGALTRQDTFVHQKGDVEKASLIYAVLREDVLIPNKPYIICEHRELAISSRQSDGLMYEQSDDQTAIRRIIAVNEDTGNDLAKDSMIVVERYCLYERSLNNAQFDIIMNGDIEMALGLKL